MSSGLDAAPGDAAPTPRRYRTLWISDLHLGMRGCQAGRVLDFLRQTESETLFLVGDVVDGWALRRSWHWPQAHNDVVQKLLRKARHGTNVVYIPGNHDGWARQFVGLGFGDVAVRQQAVHTLADGRRVLVLHGDEFDGVVRLAPWLSRLGARAYQSALALNTVVARVREKQGRPYWSLAAFLKERTKRAVQYVAEFEKAVARRAAEEGVEGIVCGHIHKPEIRLIETERAQVRYANCGDWVENCTALAEHADGRLEIIRWGAALPRVGALLEDDALGDAAGDGQLLALPRLSLPRPA